MRRPFCTALIVGLLLLSASLARAVDERAAPDPDDLARHRAWIAEMKAAERGPVSQAPTGELRLNLAGCGSA